MPQVIPILVYYAATYVGTSTLVAAVAAAAASYIVAEATQPEAKGGMREAAGRQQVVRSGVEFRRVCYGQSKVSGPLAYASTTDIDNGYLHLVIPLATHEIDAIDAVYFNDVEISSASLDGSGTIIAGQYAAIQNLIKRHLGQPGQIADDDLRGLDPTHWTGAHIGVGVAYLYVRLGWNREMFPTGIPNISARVRGKKLFDPRINVTQYSNNWALVVLDYLRAPYGLKCTDAEIDMPSFIAAANISDEFVIPFPGGTQQRRYTCDGTINLGQRRVDVLRQLLSAGAGRLIYTQGKYKLFAGAYIAPVAQINESDLSGAIKISPRIQRRDLYNAVRGTYISPGNGGWQPTDFPPHRNASYAAEDGEEIYRDIDLPFTVDPYAAQRIAKIHLERSRQSIRCSMPLKLSAMKLAAGDNIQVSIAELGWTNKEFLITNWRLDSSGQIIVELVEEASAVWAWNSGNATLIDPAPNTTLPNPYVCAPPMSLLLGSGPQYQIVATAGQILSRIRLTWTSPADQFVRSGGRIEIQYKLSSASTWIQAPSALGSDTDSYIMGVFDGVAYDVRIRAINSLGVPSVWVTSSNHVTTPKTSFYNFDNLIPNGNSEMGAAAIGLVPEGNDLVNDPANAFAGQWVRRKTLAGGFNNTYFSQKISASPGDQFYFEAHVKASSALTNSAILYLLFANSAGVYAGQAAGASMSGIGTTYQRYNVRGTVPAGCTGVWAFWEISNSAGQDTGKAIYFDNLYMRRVIDDTLLTIGNAANLVVNPALLANTAGWGAGSDTGGYGGDTVNAGRNFAAAYTPAPHGALYIEQLGSVAAGNYYWTQGGLGVIAGRRYQLSCKYQLHRCGGSLVIIWRSAAGAFIGSNSVALGSYAPAPFDSLANGLEVVVFGVAPAGTATAQIVIYKDGTTPGFGYTSSYLFATDFMFCEALPGQTIPTPWAPSGVQLNSVATQDMQVDSATTILTASFVGAVITARERVPLGFGSFQVVAQLIYTPIVSGEILCSCSGEASITTGASPVEESRGLLDIGIFAAADVISLHTVFPSNSFGRAGYALLKRFAVTAGTTYVFSFRQGKVYDDSTVLSTGQMRIEVIKR